MRNLENENKKKSSVAIKILGVVSALLCCLAFFAVVAVQVATKSFAGHTPDTVYAKSKSDSEPNITKYVVYTDDCLPRNIEVTDVAAAETRNAYNDTVKTIYKLENGDTIICVSGEIIWMHEDGAVENFVSGSVQLKQHN